MLKKLQIVKVLIMEHVYYILYAPVAPINDDNPNSIISNWLTQHSHIQFDAFLILLCSRMTSIRNNTPVVEFAELTEYRHQSERKQGSFLCNSYLNEIKYKHYPDLLNHSLLVCTYIGFIFIVSDYLILATEDDDYNDYVDDESG